MLEELQIKNYRSFVDAKAKFSPFTIVTGPNGSGKTNLLRLLGALGGKPGPVKVEGADRGHFQSVQGSPTLLTEKHRNHIEESQEIVVNLDGVRSVSIKDGVWSEDLPIINRAVLFNLDPASIAAEEAGQHDRVITPTGAGAVSILDALKTGDREDLFDRIERKLIQYVPAIQKLSFQYGSQGKKRIQVREEGVADPLPIAELSEGTRLLLLILTIVHQENRPSIVCLEDLDRGLHPRLFQNLVEHLTDLCETEQVQIIATTHNPYLIDQFAGDEASVLLVEKKAGESTISSLADRIEAGDLDEDGALGALWYGGFLNQS